MVTNGDEVEVSIAERDWDVQKAAEAEAEMIARHDAWETSEYADHVTKRQRLVTLAIQRLCSR
jgi:hypothetical protein